MPTLLKSIYIYIYRLISTRIPKTYLIIRISKVLQFTKKDKWQKIQNRDNKQKMKNGRNKDRFGVPNHSLANHSLDSNDEITHFLIIH